MSIVPFILSTAVSECNGVLAVSYTCVIGTSSMAAVPGNGLLLAEVNRNDRVWENRMASQKQDATNIWPPSLLPWWSHGRQMRCRKICTQMDPLSLPRALSALEPVVGVSKGEVIDHP